MRSNRAPKEIELPLDACWFLIQNLAVIPGMTQVTTLIDTVWPLLHDDFYVLRKKLNSCLIDAVRERKSSMLVIHNELEAWILDAIVASAEVAQWAYTFKLDLVRILWEYEYGVSLSDEKDKAFDDVKDRSKCE